MNSNVAGRVYLWVHGAVTVLGLVMAVLQGGGSLTQPIATLYSRVSFVTEAMYVVWIYMLHVDLRRLQPDYPVSPGYALALHLIPVFNIWGNWSIWWTASDHLPAPVWRGRRLPRIGLLIGLYYLLSALALGGLWVLLSRFATPRAIYKAAISIDYTTAISIGLLNFAIGLTNMLLCFSVMAALEQKAAQMEA